MAKTSNKQRKKAGRSSQGSSEGIKGPTARLRTPNDLIQFFAESPLAGAKLDLERPRDLGGKMRL
jgi:hypothetical protein